MSVRQDQMDALIRAVECVGASLTLLALVEQYRQEVDLTTRRDLYTDIDVLSARLGDRYKAVVDPTGAGSGH